MLHWLGNTCTKMGLHIGFMFVCLVASTSLHASPLSPVKSRRIMNPVVLLTGGYMAIGTSLEKNTSSVEVFSPWQNSSCSKDLENLSKGRSEHTINFFKGDVIMCGGGKDCQYLDKNQRFIHHSQLNKERSIHTATVVSNTLLIVGGSSSDSWLEPTKSMESWNGSQWVTQEINFEEIKELLIMSCMAAVSEDTILLAGGAGTGIFTNKMYKYRKGQWERMEDFPGPPRGFHGCAYVHTPEGDSFLIAGGEEDGNTYLDTSYLYNIEKRQWKEVGKLASPRSQGKILVIDGRIIIVGGHYEDYDSSMLVDVEEYNVEKKTWTTIQQKLKRGRIFFDAVVLPGALVGC